MLDSKIYHFMIIILIAIYDKDFDNLNKDPESKTKYIAHEVTDRLKTNPNVYFLTPLSKKFHLL